MSVAKEGEGLDGRRLRSIETARVVGVLVGLGWILAWAGPRIDQLMSAIMPLAGVVLLRAVVLDWWGRLLFAERGGSFGPSLATLVDCSANLVLYGLMPTLVR